jgi:hypothetical protein
MMTSMTPEEAEHFFEEDEDPEKVFAAFDAARKGVTSLPPALEVPGLYVRVRASVLTWGGSTMVPQLSSLASSVKVAGPVQVPSSSAA